MARLDGKVAIVTGAGSGIGRSSSLLFAKNGAKVVCADRDMETAEETASMIVKNGGEAFAFEIDVASEEANKALVEACVRQWKKLDVFFANAGIAEQEMDLEKCQAPALQKIFQVNVFGVFFGIKWAAKVMKQQGRGSIICTSSVAGLRNGAGGVFYSASKAAVVSLVQTCANSLAGTGVRVNAVCPGLIETAMTQMVFDHAKRRGTTHKIGQLNPTRRAGQPNEIASAVLFLASDEASYVNGIALPVCGGFSSSHPIALPRM